jgi:hypothetical protein
MVASIAGMRTKILYLSPAAALPQITFDQLLKSYTTKIGIYFLKNQLTVIITIET